jgi:hypothetical protein
VFAIRAITGIEAVVALLDEAGSGALRSIYHYEAIVALCAEPLRTGTTSLYVLTGLCALHLRECVIVLALLTIEGTGSTALFARLHGLDVILVVGAY